jgi:hypothetical protein
VDTLSVILGIVGFPVGVIGSVLGVIFYLYSRRVFRIQYESVQQEIIQESLDLPSLRLMFGQKRIHSLRIADVAVVNTGSESLRQSEHSTASPLVVKLPDTEVYGAELVQASREECEFGIERASGTGYRISFNYMDPTDGCVVRFFLGGADPARIEVSGTFQGARQVTHYRPDAIGRYLKYSSWVLWPLFAAGAAAAIFIGLYVPDGTEWKVTAAVSSAVIGVLSLLSVYVSASKYVAGLIRLCPRLTGEEHYSSIMFLRQRELPNFVPGAASRSRRQQMAG